jgi:hypothetical protein
LTTTGEETRVSTRVDPQIEVRITVSTRHTLDRLTATMSASSLMNVSRL